MDVFDNLEERIDRLITGYRTMRARVEELEAENARLKDGDQAVEAASARIAELEGDRDELRARLGRLLESLQAVDLD